MKTLKSLLHRRPRPCALCEGYGTVPRSFAFGDDPVCDCGAGEFDELTFHDVNCDTVPCPACPERAPSAVRRAVAGLLGVTLTGMRNA